MMMGGLFQRRELEDPGWYRFLFGSTALVPLWTLARLYVGWQWLQAGWHKLDGDGWINNDGSALQGFWERIVVVPEEGKPAITYGWYRDFIQYMLDHDWYTWFAWVIACGEFLVGLALIIGAFTALAALFGATMNFSFLLAGSASTNPVLLVIAILMILGWKVAGYIGVDRWLLPALGTPWQVGRAFDRFRRAPDRSG
jgi:thiosulfate dehydrogenase (quinone) large subunit